MSSKQCVKVLRRSHFLGNREGIEALIKAEGGAINMVNIIDPQDTDKHQTYKEAFFKLREKKGRNERNGRKDHAHYARFRGNDGAVR